MREGDVIKVAFQQADGHIKFRPAVLIKIIPPFNDLLVRAVSTQVQNFVPGLDVIVRQEEMDFAQTGLKQTSVIRTAKLITIPSANVEGEIGNIGSQRHNQLLDQLKRFLK